MGMMFDNLKNLGSLMAQAGQLREKFEQLQNELANKTVEGDAGAGAVRVVMNGKFEVLSVRLDRPLLAVLTGAVGAGGESGTTASDGSGSAAGDTQMIEELIAAAFNAAALKAQQLVKQEMAGLTGGMNLPGLSQLLDR